MARRKIFSGVYKLYCNLKNRKESKDDLWQFKRLKKEMNFNLFLFFRVRRWGDQIVLIWDVETSTNSKLLEKKLKIKFYKKSFSIAICRPTSPTKCKRNCSNRTGRPWMPKLFRLFKLRFYYFYKKNKNCKQHSLKENGKNIMQIKAVFF